MRGSFSVRTFTGDLFAGVTTAAVALPVALGFGLASGLGPLAGMYGAVAVCFFTAVFGSVPAQVSGTAAPMAIAMAVVVTRHAGDLTEAFTIVMLAGLIQILLGALRIGSFVTYTPYSVVSGFMSGIGVIIIVMQALPMLGGAIVPGGALDSIRAWPGAVAAVNPDASMVGAVALTVSFFWPRRFRRFLPAPLAALIIGTLAAFFWFGNAPLLGTTVSGLPSLQLPRLSPAFLVGVIQPAFILALIGSVNSLLTLLVADSLTRKRHNPNRELVGQGIGNIAAGLVGGLPGAGSPPFTVLNVSAGGRTALASIVRAAILLALALGGRIAEPVPHAALAGILVKVGWDTIDWRFLTRIHQIERGYLVVMLITLVLTVFVDLVTAVALGFIAAGIAHARDSERLELDSVVSTPLLDRTFLPDREEDTDELDPYAARVGLVALRGRFSVASANALCASIGTDIREHEVVIFDFTDTTHMDDSAALIMEQLVGAAADEDTACIVMNLCDPVAGTLRSLNVLRRVPKNHFVDGLDAARRVAKRILDGRDQ